MNTSTTVASVRNAIPVRTVQHSWCSRRSWRLILPATAATLLGACLLTLGPTQAVTDTGPCPVLITSTGGVVGVPTDADPRDETKALMESECMAQVCQGTGEQGEIMADDLRSVYTWVSGFLDSFQPSAQPVDTGDWAATISLGGKPVGLLEVVHDRGRATCTPALDDDLAIGADQMGEAHLVHDRNANAWYSPNGTTMTAVGEAATRRLADSIELRGYGEILRERAESESKIFAAQGEERSVTGGQAIWGPVLVVVVVGIVTVIITARHERKVTASLRQTRNRADMAEHADRLSRDESDTQGAAVCRGIPRAAIDLSLLGNGAGDDADATADETLGGTVPESRVNLPRNPRAQVGPVRILSIDSSPGTQVVVVDATPSATGACALQVLSQNEQVNTCRHAESLGQMLSRVLSAPEVAERPLDAVIAATGPAPFTGLRAGLITAGVVGRIRGVPVHGASSLDAIARRVLDELGTQEGQMGPVVLVATDAHRCEVYTALFRANGSDGATRLTEIIVYSPAQVARHLAEQAPGPGGGSGGIDVVAGLGASLYPELADMVSCQKTPAPVSGDALTQVRIALACLKHGEELSTQPLYLRHTDVQMPVGRKRIR